MFHASLLAAALAAAPVASSEPQREADPVAELAAWTQRARRAREGPDSAQYAELEGLVATARMLAVAKPERARDAWFALLDLASLESRASSVDLGPLARARSSLWRASSLGFEALERALDSDRAGLLPPWLATSVLGTRERESAARRRAALELLRGRREAATLLAVLSCAASDADEVRRAALDALVGWPDDGVHRFLLARFADPPDRAHWPAIRAALAHFGAVELDAGGPIATPARDAALAAVASEDWRSAARGLKLLATLPDALAFPALIESLAVWLARAEHGAGSRRIQDEIHRALKQRSGRSIPADPERWSAWWRSAAERAAQGGGADEAQVTRAGFFGLRPMSDRVVLILDRSGSMTAVATPGGRSRYDEALAQMERFLVELGPSTRFRVVLFDSELHVWSPTLRPATRETISAAVSWCAKQVPEGGTSLLPAVLHALRVKANGELDLRALEEDTAIVLCDGNTSEGAGWVGPLIERVGAEACVVFHCVQIGAAGDGTLEALARETGGDFARVLP